MNEIKLDVWPGSTSLSFQILPVNNTRLEEIFELKVALTGSDRIAAGNNSFLTIRIEEDDNILVETNSIATLKAMFEAQEGAFWIPEDYFIEGIITSSSNVIDSKMVYIQDETGGIALRFITDRKVSLGDKVRFNIKDATGELLNNQMALSGVKDISGILLSKDNHVQPEVITLSQLQSGAYQGKKVRINNIYFSEANGSVIFLGTTAITNDITGTYVTTYGSAEFANYKLPNGLVSIVGIVGDWGRILPQVYASDVIK